MKKLPMFVNEQTIALIDGVVATGLPIVITGGLVSGKSTLAEGIANDYDYVYLDEVKDSHHEIYHHQPYLGLVNAIMKGKNGKLVLVVSSITEELKELIGNHIHIKTHYNSENRERYINIFPVFPINEKRSKVLGEKANSQLVIGEHAEYFKIDLFGEEDVAVVDIEETYYLKAFSQTFNYRDSIAHILGDYSSETFNRIIFNINADKVALSDLLTCIEMFNTSLHKHKIYLNIFTKGDEMVLMNLDKSMFDYVIKL